MPTLPNTLTVHAGPHERRDCPIRFSLPEPLPDGDWELLGEDGQTRPLQRLDGNEAAFLERHLPAEVSRSYRLRAHKSELPDPLPNLRDRWEAKAKDLEVPFVDLTVYRPEPSALTEIPLDFAQQNRVLPVKRDGTNLYVAMSDPNDPALLDTLRSLTLYQIRPVLAVPEHIAVAIQRSYIPPCTLHHTPGSIKIKQGDRLLTRYVYSDVKARPYFFPLHAPGDVPITRGYPMLPDVPGEQRDHPHHRSLWIAFGEVNGADNWSEEPGHGYTLHQSTDLLDSGPVAGRFATTSLWTDSAKNALLTQSLTVTVWNTGEDVSLLDFDIRLSATHGDVVFGDTKEGGILAVRVATVLDVPRTGRIENVYGGVNEAETWGRAAHWCDYSGMVDGKPVGIALLDHPLSFRYPTHWHVRDYGLMTANPFGYAAYTNGAKNGAHTLPAGETLPFRYRLVLHRGNATEGHVNARYLDFVSPPRVEVSVS